MWHAVRNAARSIAAPPLSAFQPLCAFRPLRAFRPRTANGRANHGVTKLPRMWCRSRNLDQISSPGAQNRFECGAGGRFVNASNRAREGNTSSERMPSKTHARNSAFYTAFGPSFDKKSRIFPRTANPTQHSTALSARSRHTSAECLFEKAEERFFIRFGERIGKRAKGTGCCALFRQAYFG